MTVHQKETDLHNHARTAQMGIRQRSVHLSQVYYMLIADGPEPGMQNLHKIKLPEKFKAQ